MMSPKFLNVGLLSLIGLEVGLVFAYFITIWHQQSVPNWLDWNGLRSIPSLMQATTLFSIGILSLIVLIFRSRMKRPVSWLLPSALAVLCFYGGVDELTKLHLQLKQYDWKAIYLAILITIPLLCRRDLAWIWQAYRSIVLWVFIGLSIFLLGGFGAESIKQAINEGFSATDTLILAGKKMSPLFVAEHIRVGIEEFAELLGETFILFGVTQFVLKSLSSQPKQHTNIDLEKNA